MSHRAGPRRSWFTHYILQGTGPLLTLPTSGHISSLDSFLTQLPQLSPLLHLSANCPFSSPPPATAAPSLPATVLPAPHHCPAPRNSQISPAFFFSSPLPRTHTSRRRPSPPQADGRATSAKKLPRSALSDPRVHASPWKPGAGRGERQRCLTAERASSAQAR